MSYAPWSCFLLPPTPLPVNFNVSTSGGRGTRFSVMWGSPASQLWSGTLRGVSYDLALWVEVPPFAGLEPGDAYAVLLGLMDDEVQSDPASAISGLVASLLDRWPALGEACDEESPWATGPEIGYVSGGSMYITMTYSGADRAVSIIVAEAREFGLNWYDPNVEG